MIDLHLHLDGSLRVGTVIDLAKEQGISLPSYDEVELKPYLSVKKDCDSLVEYLKCFDLPLLVLQKESAIERVVYELIEDLYLQGVSYAQIRFAPQLSTKEGLTQEQVVMAAIRGQKRALKMYATIKTQLILCCMRSDSNKEDNEETVMLAKKYLNQGVWGIDLAGAESLYPTKAFEDIFAMAKGLKIPFTIHAGEADGPLSVKKAIEMGAVRIGHGIRVVEDESVIELIKEKGIILEVCVISNVQTKACESIEKHPIKYLFDKGVKVTYNTDNMTVSDTNLKRERQVLKDILGFSENEILAMEGYAKEAFGL